MKKLLEYILEEITGKKNFKIEEEKGENSVNFVIKAPAESLGLIIGKKGRTIRAIRNLLRVAATLEKKAVSLSVSES